MANTFPAWIGHTLAAFTLLTLEGCADVQDASTQVAAPEGDTAAVATDDDARTSAPVTHGAAQAAPAPTRAPTPAATGTWYLSVDGVRHTLTLAADDVGALSGAMSVEGDEAHAGAVHDVEWDAARGSLRFSSDLPAGRTWVDVTLADGFAVGRVARGETQPTAAAYTSHVSGWSDDAPGRDIVPRVFDVRIADGRHARLRVDRAAGGELVGTLKVYMREGVGTFGEELEYDLSSVTWNGAKIGFTVTWPDQSWAFTGDVTGRALSGTASRLDRPGESTWTATRAEVFSHGIAARRDPAWLTSWQEATRRRLLRALMNGAPVPAQTRVTVVQENVAPMTTPTRITDEEHPADYTLTELVFEHILTDPRGGPSMARQTHAWLARPSTTRPQGGWPVVIAFNGHGGSARQVMDPTRMYGYGDAYARRGYVVLAVDVSHRPIVDRAGLYLGYDDGDDAPAGNATHPAVASRGYDTDWEEDGERVWDGMRALDWLLEDPAMNQSRVLSTGLSMGGEVATLFGALDPRVDAVVTAGYAPDFAVMMYHGNHPCWRWLHADVLEYVDVSDYHALLAPRALVVETGKVDGTFSSLATPWADDKQVLRRSRVAWREARRVVHDLHDGAHVYHMGDPTLDASTMRGVMVSLRTAPDVVGSTLWQSDGETTLWPATVIDLTRMLMPMGRF